MLVALLGYPGCGKRTVLSALRHRFPSLQDVSADVIRLAVRNPRTETAARAARLASGGASIPDSVMGRLLAEAIVSRPASQLTILRGLPRNVAQLEAFATLLPSAIHSVHLEITLEVLDARRLRSNQPTLESAHPGALDRIARQLRPLLDALAVRGPQLEVDAGLPIATLVRQLETFLCAGLAN